MVVCENNYGVVNSPKINFPILFENLLLSLACSTLNLTSTCGSTLNYNKGKLQLPLRRSIKMARHSLV
jgi:hypothetical protein